MISLLGCQVMICLSSSMQFPYTFDAIKLQLQATLCVIFWTAGAHSTNLSLRHACMFPGLSGTKHHNQGPLSVLSPRLLVLQL